MFPSARRLTASSARIKAVSDPRSGLLPVTSSGGGVSLFIRHFGRALGLCASHFGLALFGCTLSKNPRHTCPGYEYTKRIESVRSEMGRADAGERRRPLYRPIKGGLGRTSELVEVRPPTRNEPRTFIR